MKKAKTIMIQGTSSSVGKSILCTALCRIFVQDNYRTAPFKAQNMATNITITPDGGEISRAQGVQAEAAGIKPDVLMNPILLKPKQDMVSQVVVLGKPVGDMSARQYREDFLSQAEPLVLDCLNKLKEEYEILVLEGAGSPAEINLKDRDIVNMKTAELADAPVLLVADIDRGGVFASLIGTLELLDASERQRIKGFVINKFRGDISLLQPGLDYLTERTGIPVIGVVPYIHDHGIDEEDSTALSEYKDQGDSHLLQITRRSGRPVKDFDGAVTQTGHVFGTCMHGLFDNPNVMLASMNTIRREKKLKELDYNDLPAVKRQKKYDLLADRVRRSLNMDLIYEIINS